MQYVVEQYTVHYVYEVRAHGKTLNSHNKNEYLTESVASYVCESSVRAENRSVQTVANPEGPQSD